MTTGWPFLVARGRTRDYRTVLVPDFLADRGLHALLGDTLPIPEPGAPAGRTTVEHPDTGTLTVSSRCAVLRPTDVDASTTRDEHGRPLVYLYGMVQGPNAPGTDPDDARERALSSYRRFLADEQGFTFDRSVAFPRTPPIPAPATPVPQRGSPPVIADASIPERPLAGHRPATGLRPEQARPPGRNVGGRGSGARTLTAVAGGAVLVALAVVAAVVLTREPNPNLTVCADGGGLRLTGVITLDTPGDVTFGLQVGGEELSSAQRRFVAGRQEFNIAVPAKGPATLPQEGEVMITTTTAGNEARRTYPYQGCATG